jgi:integrase
MSVYEQNSKWYYNFMLYGIRKHGACKGCRTRSEALEFEAEIKNDVSLIHRNKKDLSEIIKVKQMFDEYLEYSEINNKPDVYRDNKHKVDVMQNFFGADTTIDKITPATIEKLKAYIIDALKLTKATFNRYFASLRKAFNLIIINHRLNLLNPCKLVSTFVEDNHIDRYLSEDEEKRLMKELPKYLKPIVICALTTGLRKSNILNLKWENINFEYGYIEILKQENKGKKEIKLPLSKKFKKELEKIGIKESGYVFTSHRGNKPYTNIDEGFKQACVRAGIENFRFHDLRHTVGTRLVANGSDLQTVKQYLAHSDLKTTQRYLHTVEENMLKAIDILDSF